MASAVKNKLRMVCTLCTLCTLCALSMLTAIREESDVHPHRVVPCNDMKYFIKT